jgi:hypothetical protein
MTAANVAFDDHPNDKRFSGRIETVTVDSVFAWLQRSGHGLRAARGAPGYLSSVFMCRSRLATARSSAIAKGRVLLDDAHRASGGRSRAARTPRAIRRVRCAAIGHHRHLAERAPGPDDLDEGCRTWRFPRGR